LWGTEFRKERIAFMKEQGKSVLALRQYRKVLLSEKDDRCI
jgi:hypothetical protein